MACNPCQRESITIAVEGCAHGELDGIYASVLETQKRIGKKIDLLICCGDFQAVRNLVCVFDDQCNEPLYLHPLAVH